MNGIYNSMANSSGNGWIQMVCVEFFSCFFMGFTESILLTHYSDNRVMLIRHNGAPNRFLANFQILYPLVSPSLSILLSLFLNYFISNQVKTNVPMVIHIANILTHVVDCNQNHCSKIENSLINSKIQLEILKTII